ncbi:MAG: DUF4097 family beta strand repeat protein [Clostridia bacterium]|nr:DUF4097 family beta strand repeat protein [Clostridia bacterium]
MKKAAIVAVVFMLIGIAVIAAVLIAEGPSFDFFDMENYEMTTYHITENFDKISVVSDTADVSFFLSDNGKCRVECYERKNLRYSVATIDDGTLCVELVDSRKWYEHISFFSFDKDEIKVYLPKAEYESLRIKNDTGDVEIPNVFRFGNVDITLSTGDAKCFASVSEKLKIKTSTGAIRVEGVSAGELELSTSTGDIKVSDVTCTGNIKLRVSTGKTTLTDISCTDLVSDGSTGDITLENVIASGMFDIERSTGDVDLTACDAASVKIETDTGHVKGTFLTDKIFYAKSDTGSIKVPKSTTGGLCEIETDTGDIKIELVK